METISSSVGKKGVNKFKDVSTVQTLLNNCMHLMIPLKLLSVDGKIGSKTIDAITEFQHRVLKYKDPDGRVDPNGATLKALNQKQVLAAQPAFVKPTGTLPKSGYNFPLKSRPVESFKTGMRRFGSNRSKGRKHAGCDLYAPVGTPVYALDDGEVLKDLYAFYLGTYALEVKHPNFVARYGELKSAAPSIKKGSKIKKGDLIGYIGELRGLNMSMLHLELYSGTATGPLTVRGNPPYQRRSDLIDPTNILENAR